MMIPRVLNYITPSRTNILQHPVLWVVLNISTIVLKRRLKRLQLQHPMKQVGLMIYSKTSMVRKSDNVIYHKIQKPCNENLILKSTDLLQAQMFIESWPISTALVPYNLRFSQGFPNYCNNNIISKLCYSYRNYVAILKKWEKMNKRINKKEKQNKQNNKTKPVTTYNSHCLYTSHMEMLSSNCSEWSTGRTYISCTTVIIVKW